MDATSRRLSLRGLLLAFVFSVKYALADIQPSFVWGFFTFNATVLPECARLQIYVGTTGNGITTASQPPYTMIAYEAGGITTTQSVGTDIQNLWWIVDHASGAQLVLSMADAAGNAGGVATDLYTVSATTNTSCHAQNPTSPVSITTNTTTTLKSCDVLPLKISGGQKPYTITVATNGSSTVTNVTLGPAYDTYNWVSRAAPSSRLLATVSDATGVYSAATGILATTGSTDLTCGGLQSTQIDSTGQVSPVQSGTAPYKSGSTATSTSAPGSSSGISKATLFGAIAGGAVLVGALVIGAIIFLRRRKPSAHGPRPYIGDESYGGFGLGKVGGVPGHSHGYMPHAGEVQGHSYGYMPHAEEVTPFVTAGPQSTPYRDNNTAYAHDSYSSTASETNDVRASTYASAAANVPPGAMSPPPSSRSFEPYAEPPVGSPLPHPIAAASGSASGSVSGRAVAGPSTLAVANPGVQEERGVKGGRVPQPPRQESIYQHADISDVVELPPAYRERT